MAISASMDISLKAFPEEKKLPMVRATNNIQIIRFFFMTKADKVSEIK